LRLIWHGIECGLAEFSDEAFAGLLRQSALAIGAMFLAGQLARGRIGAVEPSARDGKAAVSSFLVRPIVGQFVSPWR
jgi:hypothetical protein